jgi:hypothetical protein
VRRPDRRVDEDHERQRTGFRQPAGIHRTL